MGIMTLFALGGLVLAGLVAFAAIAFINHTSDKIDTIQKDVTNTTNITNSFCEQSDINQVIKDQTGLCKTPGQ